MTRVEAFYSLADKMSNKKPERAGSILKPLNEAQTEEDVVAFGEACTFADALFG